METSRTKQQMVTKAIHWVYSSYTAAKPYIVPGPDRMIRHPEWTRKILDELGAPDRAQCNVAVTGSKGKGTHAILLAAMLQKYGLRVGLFTSPHLVNFLERFRVNGTIITENDFLQMVAKVQKVTAGFQLPYNQYIGPVGILASIAALWFSEQRTDVNIFELGRGALHDDVNQIHHIGAVLTPVFLEHTFELGPTLAEVSREKAGVITSECKWVVSYCQMASVRNILSVIGKNRIQSYLNEDIEYYMHDTYESDLTVQVSVSDLGCPSLIKIGRMISCYAGNIAVASTAARRVYSEVRPGSTPPSNVDLTDLYLPGRMQVLSDNPLRFVDGTVHRTNAKLIAKWLDDYVRTHQNINLGLVLSIPAAKDGQGVIGTLAQYFSWIYVVKAQNLHLVYTDDLLNYVKGCTSHAIGANHVIEAMDQIRANGQSRDGICFLGTQSFVGDVLSLFASNTETIWGS